MSIRISEYTETTIPAVRQFNGRLKAGGADSQFPLSPVSEWLPKVAGRRLFQEYYLAIDETAAVRGAYILKHQDFWIKDQAMSVADIQLPISEGRVNKDYPQIGVQLLRDAIRRQPLMFGLGMGGYGESLPQLLKAAGWSMFSVPFFFRVVHPTAFLRNATHLRRRPARRRFLDILAMTGLGWLGIRAAQTFCCPRTSRYPDLTVELVDEFATWADELWQQHKGQYGMAAVRDAETLRILYPKQDSRFIRLKIIERSRPIGWAVMLNTALSNHKHFGSMRLGSIVDCFAATEDAAKVVSAARDYLETQGVDLIVSNQAHIAWAQGLQKAGFFRGPSNFIFASSRQFTELLRRKEVGNDDLHINRGDGDGPINL